MQRHVSRLLAGATLALAIGFLASPPAMAILPPANSYVQPLGPKGMTLWGSSTLGYGSTGIVTVSSGANILATGSVVVSNQVHALTVEASASSASTLVLTGYMDTAGTYQAWQATVSVPGTGVWTAIFAPTDEPFQAFRADIKNTATGTFSAEIDNALGQD